MKNRLALGLLISVAATGAPAAPDCAQLKGCEAKACQLERQIEAAQKAGNSAREDGLKTALSKVVDHCSDDSLKDKLQDDIDKSQEEIKEYQRDLDEASNDGRSDKVAKYQRKIEEEQATLDALLQEMDGLK